MRRPLAFLLGATLVFSACDSGGGGGGGGTAAGNVDAYCEAVRSFQALEDDLEPEVPADASPEEAFAAMRESFERLRAQVEELRDVAPAEIRNDVNQLVEAILELIDLFLEIDDPTDLTANQEALSRMSELQQEVATAQERVADFTEEECGIDLDEDETGEVPVPGDQTDDTTADTTADTTGNAPGEE